MKQLAYRKRGAIIGAIIGGVIFTFLPPLFGFVDFWGKRFYYEYLVDTEDVFVYEAVIPVQNPNTIGGRLQMASVSGWHKAGWDVVWNDVLFCEKDGLVSSSKEYRDNYQTNETGVIEERPWVYNGSLPMAPQECHMKSTIEACIYLGVCKQKTIESGPIFFE